MKCLFILLLVCQSIHAQPEINLKDKEGRKQGLWLKYWDESKSALQYKGAFIDDLPVGQFWYYYPKGEIRAIIEHVNARRSYVSYYFENKEVMSEGMYIDQKRDSIWINYNQQGLTVSMEKYRKGKLNGKKVMFYLQNQIEQGETRMLSETYYVDSLKSGSYREFFSSGNIKLMGQFELGLPAGIWRKYNTKEQQIQSYHYKNGLKHGWVYNYNENGERLISTLYKKGNLLTGKEKSKYLEACKLNGIDPND